MKKISKSMINSAIFTGMMSVGVASYANTTTQELANLSQMKLSTIKDFTNDSRTFKIDPTIEVKKVSFENRYGFTVVGDMYLPKNFSANNRYKAIVISGPFGAVKEQSSGLYAQELAKNGFVTVAFDPSMTGESSGKRRNMGSPEIFTEDYHAAVDFVSNLKFVNSDQIGVLGICGLSGMAITAAASDSRIKAAATSAMYDMSESISDHYKDSYYTDQQREIVKKYLAKMRDDEAKSGSSIRGAHELAVDPNVQTYDMMFPNELPEGTNVVVQEFYNYYVKRAYHQNAINSNTSAWDSTTPYGFFDFNLMDNIEELGNTPVLLITGSAAHSKYFSDKVFAKIKGEKKEEIVVPNATHTDLYDNMTKIPFAKLVNFYQENLK